MRAVFARRRAFGALAALGAIGACAREQGPMVAPNAAPPSQPLPLQVAEIRVVDERSEESKGDFRQQSRRERLATWAVAQLAQDFAAAGGSDRALVAIEAVGFDARTVRGEGRLAQWIEREPAERFSTEIVARISVIDPEGVEAAYALARAEAQFTTPINATSFSRDRFARELIEATVIDLRAALRLQARTHLARWIAA